MRADSSDPLRLVMEVSGDLTATAAKDGQSLILKDAKGHKTLRYEKLKVWDADMTEQTAKMKVADNKVYVEVEEAAARYPLTIDPTFAETAKLTASDGAAADRFGYRVGISGDTAVVGLRYDNNGVDSGSAYIYVRSGANWTEQQKLTASDATPRDFFGEAVAISGDTAIVGAYGDDDNVADSGSAYIYERSGTTWTEQAKLTASDATSTDLFGSSVAISGDTAIVGAQFDDDDGNNSGSAYIFTFQNNLSPTANAGDDQAIQAGDTVDLDGSASFDDNTASNLLQYSWSFTSKPAGSNATLADANTATPSFVADLDGDYVVELEVTDECDVIDTDEVVISSDNLAPTAVAGDDKLVIVGNSVGLDGSGSSDPEMDFISYSWTLTTSPAGSGATLSGADTAMPSFTPDLEGTYLVTLVISDFIGPGLPDTVEITATSANGFAENRIMTAAGIVDGLNSGQVTTKGNQKAFGNFLNQAIKALQKSPPQTATAINKLENAIERTDGCVLRGSPDGNGSGRDWITDCAVQAEVYQLLNEALNALTTP